MSDQPIFVVGASRSGTALLRSCLNQHSAVHLAGETHYFDDLRTRLSSVATSQLSDEQRTVAEDYFLALAHRPYGHGGVAAESPLDRQLLRDEANGIGHGSDAYFEAYCRIAARDHEKSGRWGEKTPRHVFRMADILSRYPEAQVICAVRDPRAVIASYRDWRHQGGFDIHSDPGHADALEVEEERASKSYDLRLATILWRSTVGAAETALRRFGPSRIRIQRYEDLVTDPAATMRDVAEWLGLEFEVTMTDVPVHNSSFSTFDAHGGVSTEPLQRWRQKLNAHEIATVQMLAGSAMRRHGYAPLPVGVYRLSAVAGLMALPIAVTRAGRANQARMGKLPSYVWRRVKAVTAR